MLRSAIFRMAKCFLQAAADARAAVSALSRAAAAAAESHDGGVARARAAALAEAYLCLGRAALAEPGHPDRSPREAAKAFMLGSDADPDGGLPELTEGLREASEELTKEALEELASEVYREGAAAGGLRHPGALGFADAPAPGQRLFRAELRLAFPQTKGVAALTARARELLRAGLAAAAGVDARRVAIERVLPPSPVHPYLGIEVHAQVGSDLVAGGALVKAVAASGDALAVALGGDELLALLGPPDAAACSAELVDVTPHGPPEDVATAAAVNEEHGGSVAPEAERRLAQARGSQAVCNHFNQSRC